MTFHQNAFIALSLTFACGQPPHVSNRLQVTAPTCDSLVEGKLIAGGPLTFLPNTASVAVLPLGHDGFYAGLLPHPTPGSSVAVWSEYLDSEPHGRDHLIVLEGDERRQTSLWSPGGRLLMLGRTGEHVVMIHFDGADARIAAVRLSDARVQSAPIALSRERYGFDPSQLYYARTFPMDAAPPLSAPRGADYLLPCDGQLCRVAVTNEGVDIEVLEIPSPGPEPSSLSVFPEWIAVSEPGSMTWLGCVPVQPGPLADWSVELSPCPEAMWPERWALPVDGRPVMSSPATVRSCWVQTEIELPGSPTSDCSFDVPPSEPGTWMGEVSVAGGCTLTFGFNEWRLAAVPGTVDIRTLPNGRYGVRFPQPRIEALERGDCAMGEAWVETRGHRHAIEWEFGFCE